MLPDFVTLVLLISIIFMLTACIIALLANRNGKNRTNYSYNSNDYVVVTRYKDKHVSAELLEYFCKSCETLFPYLSENADTDFKRNIVERMKLFDPSKLREADPTWTIGHKAMTTHDGYINICLRNKFGKILNRDILYFVFLHELSHVLTDTKYIIRTGNKVQDDHPREFWAVFKYLLIGAVDLNQIEPVRYDIYPDVYLNSEVSYNPYWDEMLDILLDE